MIPLESLVQSQRVTLHKIGIDAKTKEYHLLQNRLVLYERGENLWVLAKDNYSYKVIFIYDRNCEYNLFR